MPLWDAPLTTPDASIYAAAHGLRVQGQAAAMQMDTVMWLASMGKLRVRMLPTQNPLLSRDAEFFPGSPKSWGLSFMINEEKAPTGRSAGSLAWAGLANTYFWIDLQKKLAGVVLMQVLPFVDPKALGRCSPPSRRRRTHRWMRSGFNFGGDLALPSGHRLLRFLRLLRVPSRSAASTSASIIQRTTASVSRSFAPQMSLRMIIGSMP